MGEAKTVLITGGAGFIGSHLAESCLADGLRVTVIDDLSTGSRGNIRHLEEHARFRFETGSVLDEGACERLVGACEEVIHLAAAVGVGTVFARPADTIRRNVRGTENVLAAAERHGRKVFVASTSEVYGRDARAGKTCFRETDEITLGPSMRWCYACSKALDEYLARACAQESGLRVVVGRIFNTVGPRQSGAYGMVIPRFVEWALAGDPLQVYGDGLQVRTFTHVLDTVRAIRLLMAAPRAEGEVVNIGSAETVSILELARMVKDAAASASEIVHVPYEKAYAPGFEDIRNRVPDLTKLHDLTGFRAERTLAEILTDTIRFFRDGGER